MQQIGQLFLLRSNINSVGSVLDSPVSTDLAQALCASINVLDGSRKSFGHEFPHSILVSSYLTYAPQTFPDQQPLYDAARSYLEIPQRINLLNTRVEVISYPVIRTTRAHINYGPGVARYVTIAQRIGFE